MHRLVQEVLRNQLTNEDQKIIANQIITLLIKAYSNDERDFTAWLKRRNEWLLNARQAQHWIHLFQLQSQGIGTLLNQMGYFFVKIGDYQQALPLFEESLEILRKVLGEQHPNTKMCKANYEICLAASKNLEKPDSFDQSEVKIKTNQIGRNAPCPCGSSKQYKHCCGKLV